MSLRRRLALNPSRLFRRARAWVLLQRCKMFVGACPRCETWRAARKTRQLTFEEACGDSPGDPASL
jgi:hypothetical protein